jgi:hypothetical protein
VTTFAPCEGLLRLESRAAGAVIFFIGPVLCFETNATGVSIGSLLPGSSPVFRSGNRSRARQSACRLALFSALPVLVSVLALDFSPLPCSSRDGFCAHRLLRLSLD